MKALALTQPWAFLVAQGLKTIENRTWKSKFRGDVLIHAAKRMTPEDYAFAVAFTHRVNPAIVIPSHGALARGGIIGRARIVDAIPPCEKPGTGVEVPCACGRRWHSGSQFGFVVEGAVPLDFFPWKGSLGFFEIPNGKLPPEWRITC